MNDKLCINAQTFHMQLMVNSCTSKEYVDCTDVLCFIKDKYKGKMIMNTLTSSK